MRRIDGLAATADRLEKAAIEAVRALTDLAERVDAAERRIGVGNGALAKRAPEARVLRAVSREDDATPAAARRDPLAGLLDDPRLMAEALARGLGR